MTTFAEMKDKTARALRDPDHKTFLTTDIADIVNMALTEVGRIVPDQFQEEIAVVADTLAYTVHQDVFDVPVPEIELAKVEVWNGSVTPAQWLTTLRPASGEYINTTAAGWFMWGGVLRLTNAVQNYLDPDVHVLRIWGYSPYLPLVADADVLPVSNEVEQAMLIYTRVEGLSRLSLDRDLFTQWQTRSNNTDVSPAALLNGLVTAEDKWRRLSRSMLVLREVPS